MSARFFLYRRNGSYYFRWTIPLACRQRMPLHEPGEVRISLRTHEYNIARRLAAQLWLAATDIAVLFLAANSVFRYKDLQHAIRGRVSMGVDQSASEDGDGQLVTLGTLLGSADRQRLQDAIAILQGAGADMFVEVFGAEATLWDQSYNNEGELESEVVDVLDQFTDTEARLTRKGITAALAAEKNLFDVHEVYSDQTGMCRGDAGRRDYLRIALLVEVPYTLSSLKVASKWASTLKTGATGFAPVHTTSPVAASSSDCEPILLSKARDTWLRANNSATGGDWTHSTVSNNGAAVSQFIDIVGDKLTTHLLAADFSRYETMMRSLPKNWAMTRKRTGLDIAQIALRDSALPRVSNKTLKDKGSSLGAFFSYLKGGGFWHGRYGSTLFHTVGKKKKNKRDKTIRHTFSDAELQQIFSGTGIAAFKKARFPVHIWGSLLLLYTGARAGEISQLRPADCLQDEDGVWYIRIITGDEEDEDDAGDGQGGHQKTAKNEASVRKVPLHPELISLGFLKFIASAGRREWLFPESTRNPNKLGKPIGDFFNKKVLVASGLKAPGVVLHSLRHTVINRFKHDAGAAYLACAYTGHHTELRKAASNVVFDGTYGNMYSMKLLASRLHPLLGFDIDWEPMKLILADRKWA